MTPQPLVLLERPEPGVGLIRLADPDRRNAIGHRMRDDLVAAVRAVADDRSVRAVVVTGDGPAFCAGAEFVDTFSGVSTMPVAEVRSGFKLLYASFMSVRDLPIPTIAAVRGPAIGAGLNLACCCDVRLGAPDASFGAVFTKIGLHPGGGCTYFLVHALGTQRAIRILLEGGTLDARESLARGLIDEIVDDPLRDAIDMASRWAALDPEIARSVKRSVRLADEQGLEASFEFESWAQAAAAQGPQIAALVERAKMRKGPSR